MIIAFTVNEQMHELILNLILERRIKPGERVNPKQIAEENHVSLMPVRNALQQLTTEGLLETLYMTLVSSVLSSDCNSRAAFARDAGARRKAASDDC